MRARTPPDVQTGTFPTQQSPRRLRLTLGYRGSAFAGWARQAAGRSGGRPTVQAVVEEALARLLRHPVRVSAAGRTDAGVHAEGQVVSFETPLAIPADGLVRALSAALPADLWVVDGADAAPGFDARRSARRRWYRYAIWRGSQVPACWQGRCLVHPAALDLPAMRRATRLLVGRHDVATFVGGWGRDARPGRSTVRTVYAADWLARRGQPLLLFEVCADSFLRQMVRAMVGSLLWVGEGRWRETDLAAALAARDRRAAGPAAPAVGLTLWKVEY